MIWAVLPGNHEPRGALGGLLLPWCRRGLGGPRRLGGRGGAGVRGEAQGGRRGRGGRGGASRVGGGGGGGGAARGVGGGVGADVRGDARVERGAGAGPTFTLRI